VSTDNKPATSTAEASRAFAVTVSAAIFAIAVMVGLLGFVVMPVLEGQTTGLDSFTAICRAFGIGIPAEQNARSSKPSAPASSTAWDSATRNDVRRSDAAAGAALAQDTCAACHMPNGLSADPASVPSTTGLSARAIYKQLHDMKRGERVNEAMKGMLDELTDQNLTDLAAYYSSLPRRNHDIRAYNEVTPNAVVLATKGDVSRALPACEACHNPTAGGPLEVPALTGQYPAYIVTQLQAYAAGTRKNDLYGRMRRIAGKLTPAEIAAYYDAPRP